VLSVNPLCTIMVCWKSFRNNLKFFCHLICNRLYLRKCIARDSSLLQENPFCFKRILSIARESCLLQENLLQENPFYYKIILSIARESFLLQENLLYCKRILSIARTSSLLQENPFYCKKILSQRCLQLRFLQVLQRDAACCSVLQCVSVCCSLSPSHSVFYNLMTALPSHSFYSLCLTLQM